MRRPIILVHGFWLGGWAWDEVRGRLEAAGHLVLAPTLPGNEVGASRVGIGLEEHIRSVVELIDHTDGQVVLVGHSAGGTVVHGALDRRVDRVARVVYLDTRPVPDGECVNPVLAGDGDEVPVRPLADFAPGWLDDMDVATLARFEALSTPSPARAARDLQELHDSRRYDVPITIVATTFTAEDARRRVAEADPLWTDVGRISDVTIVELPTSHYPMLSKPAETAAIILAAAEG